MEEKSREKAQRPTQAYYIPRKVLESGRNIDNEKKKPKKSKNGPRPLMEKIISPPPALIQEKPKPKSVLKQKNNQKEYHGGSTASSRSSSSMSQQASYQLSPTLTCSTPRVLHTGTRTFNSSTFSPKTSDECVCHRNNAHVICKRCGFECVGRVRQTCGMHQFVISLNDFKECPNEVCKSIELLELELHASIDDVESLAKPIELIDLKSNDDY